LRAYYSSILFGVEVFAYRTKRLLQPLQSDQHLWLDQKDCIMGTDKGFDPPITRTVLSVFTGGIHRSKYPWRAPSLVRYYVLHCGKHLADYGAIYLLILGLVTIVVMLKAANLDYS